MTEQTAELKRLIASVQIEDVRLLEGFCQTSINAEGVRPSELLMTPGVGLACALDQNRRFRIHARMEAQVSAKSVAANQEPEGPLMVFRIIHELTYSVSGEETFTDVTLRAFATNNAVFNAWPYWRTFVQNCTAQMGLPRLIVPVFRGFPVATVAPLGDRLEAEGAIQTAVKRIRRATPRATQKRNK